MEYSTQKVTDYNKHTTAAATPYTEAQFQEIVHTEVVALVAALQNKRCNPDNRF